MSLDEFAQNGQWEQVTRRGLSKLRPPTHSLAKLLVSFVHSSLEKQDSLPESVIILTDLDTDILAIAHLSLRHMASIYFRPYSFDSLLDILGNPHRAKSLVIVFAEDCVSDSSRAQEISACLYQLFPSPVDSFFGEILKVEEPSLVSELIYQESSRIFKTLEIEQSSYNEIKDRCKNNRPSFATRSALPGWGAAAFFLLDGKTSLNLSVERVSLSRSDITIDLPKKIAKHVLPFLISRDAQKAIPGQNLVILTPYLSLTACIYEELKAEDSSLFNAVKLNLSDVLYGWHPGVTLTQMLTQEGGVMIQLEPLSMLKIVAITP